MLCNKAVFNQVTTSGLRVLQAKEHMYDNQTSTGMTNNRAPIWQTKVQLYDVVVCFTGRALDEDELDAQCEAYLAQRFGQRLDFDISGSLQSLLAEGVVLKDSRVSQSLPPLLQLRFV